MGFLDPWAAYPLPELLAATAFLSPPAPAAPPAARPPARDGSAPFAPPS